MSQVNEQIQKLIDDNKVVLFMKGTPVVPRCGFSALAVDVLTRCGAEIKDVNVLDDPQMRESIKAFSNWPTVPQIYIEGKFVGGSDILIDMYETGELQKLLGDGDGEDGVALVPRVTLTSVALDAITAAAGDVGDDVLRLDISTSFQHNLYFGAKRDDDLEVDAGGIVIHLTPHSAKRADGVTLDYVDSPEGEGFKLENPNAPADV